MRWRKHPIHYWEQTKQTRSKKVETFTLNPYLPEDSFIFIGLAVNWLKMNGHGSFKNPEISAASARKSFLVILNRHDVKHWKIFAGFKKTSKKANIDARQNNWTFRGWRGMHDALIIPLVHLKSLVISLFHLKKIITENDKKTLLLFLAQRQPPFHNSPERDGGVESREWLHYWFQRQNFGYVGILIRFFP